ncbi:ribonuclease H-like domain-containing protein [Tanacetum coccineum]
MFTKTSSLPTCYDCSGDNSCLIQHYSLILIHLQSYLKTSNFNMECPWDTDIQEKEQKENQKQTNPSTEWKRQSVSSYQNHISKTSKNIIEKAKTVRPIAPIIEEWDTDSDNDSVFRPKSDQTKPKFTKINFVKSGENVKSVNKENTYRQVEYLRKKKPVLNNKGRVTSQREIRPVWNNTQRVNHKNKFTHPHPKRNFVPTAVATKSGQVPVNAAKQSSPRAVASISTARPVNTAAPKPKVNDALPTTYSYFKAHSPVRRAFNQKSAAKTNNFNKKVNTARVNNVTTAGSKAVVSAAEGNGENAVKSSACWIWRPIGNVIDHTSKDSGSYMLKRFDYVDLQGRLNGCSRHMTGNKSFLTDYQEIDGGFVAFAGSPKGGKITGKGKIRTGKLDFEDVYFVKELKFNLFSVSQMCDKKNSVLFTETECLVLSPDFKLLDESQVLLKVPRQNNMYSFDLKNVVPSGGLTCLFAKATIDESNLWHRRLGHINFKTMNKLVRGNLVRGLPSKLFENDHTCVACQKGKQHKASCKTKLVSSISQPLQMLHMDLFGPTFVRSINHKIYCLVVTDDYSRSRRDIQDVLKQRVQRLRRVLDGAFGGVGDEEVVVGEGVVVLLHHLVMLTNSCLCKGLMVNLIFWKGLKKSIGGIHEIIALALGWDSGQLHRNSEGRNDDEVGTDATDLTFSINLNRRNDVLDGRRVGLIWDLEGISYDQLNS